MLKHFVTIGSLIIITALSLGLWQLQNPDSFLRQQLTRLSDELPTIPSLSSQPILRIPAVEITTPGPLRGRTDAPSQTLTASGTLAETNAHRAKAGAPQLVANAKLAAAAQAKLNDMFTQQYFEHIGPDGKGPAEWVQQSGYAYIAVGENLALGNFDGDAALVNAWMASPGHRANLLNKNFVEIGIAVGQGTFEGEKTWLAVQTFGTPTSACPGVSVTLRQQFEQKKALAAQIENELVSTRATLDQAVARHDQLLADGNAKIEEGNRASKRGDQEEAERLWAEGQALQNQARELEPQIKQRQDAYNSFISQLNTLNNEIIQLANQINAQIDAYNTCVARFGS